MSETERPHPNNADGPFYVVDGCCTACGVPVSAAPELFSWDSSNHCFVKRQPEGEAETNRAIQAVRGAELQCIRYRGNDPDLLRRFAELGEPELCDFGSRTDLAPVIRNNVTFQLEEAITVADLAGRFRDYILFPRASRNRAKPIDLSGATASLSFAWFEEQYHRVEFTKLNDISSEWLASHSGNLGVSDWIQEWLVSTPDISNIQWFPEKNTDRVSHPRRTPY